MITRALFDATLQAVCDVVGASEDQRSGLTAALLPMAAAGGLSTDASIVVAGFAHGVAVEILPVAQGDGDAT